MQKGTNGPEGNVAVGDGEGRDGTVDHHIAGGGGGMYFDVGLVVVWEKTKAK
jgi:hypothetical protein